MNIFEMQIKYINDFYKKIYKSKKESEEKVKKDFPHNISKKEDEAWEYLEEHLNGKVKTHE